MAFMAAIHLQALYISSASKINYWLESAEEAAEVKTVTHAVCYHCCYVFIFCLHFNIFILLKLNCLSHEVTSQSPCERLNNPLIS
ncbi:hypothetical protein T4D_15285 [Trichinella pseudospiralis]|uniref:Uncharacterized protein n=1 Tax=Trichinella pseudospiralis TaxID=6337 RepID=A0A0V1FF33_TRIPS|nr:hypothetical protein T4D_15285 [Trichinella pseudospiralis]